MLELMRVINTNQNIDVPFGDVCGAISPPIAAWKALCGSFSKDVEKVANVEFFMMLAMASEL